MTHVEFERINDMRKLFGVMLWDAFSLGDKPVRLRVNGDGVCWEDRHACVMEYPEEDRNHVMHFREPGSGASKFLSEVAFIVAVNMAVAAMMDLDAAGYKVEEVDRQMLSGMRQQAKRIVESPEFLAARLLYIDAAKAPI